jgi:hypothetical protein
MILYIDAGGEGALTGTAEHDNVSAALDSAALQRTVELTQRGNIQDIERWTIQSDRNHSP